MADGILGGLPPGLRGWVAADTIQNQRNAQNLQNLGGILAIQNQLEDRPIQRMMQQVQLQNAMNPAPTRVDLGGSIGLFDRTGNKIGEIPKTATPDALVRERGSMERHLKPSGSAILGERGAQMRHETPSAGSRLTADVAMRGQNMTDARSRDQNAIAAEGKINDRIMSIRKEFNDVDEVKKYRAVAPILSSIKQAPDTPAGDLDFIYAVGKVLDPTSVVREGEMNLVVKTGSPLERFKGAVNYIQGGGRLTPATRKELENMLNIRVGELEKGYQSARNLYGTSAAAQGLPANQIFMENTYGRRGSDRGQTPPVGSIVDGYRFKGGDPSQQSSWERM